MLHRAHLRWLVSDCNSDDTEPVGILSSFEGFVTGIYQVETKGELLFWSGKRGQLQLNDPNVSNEQVQYNIAGNAHRKGEMPPLRFLFKFCFSARFLSLP
jgi:hypothetical protein